MDNQRKVPEGTVTFLFTDIEGSTQLLDRLRDQYAILLADQRLILREAFAQWNGSEIDTQGDAFFVAFPRATEGVSAAVDIQRALMDHAWPQGVELRVRMGLHTGEPLKAEEGYVGMDVHRAARIAHVGHGGQVLLSETTTALVRDELPFGIRLRNLGNHQLKDLLRPERIHQLNIPDLPSEFPPLRSLDAYPNNLPPQLTSFVGREQEIEQIKDLLTHTRLLTLTGAGGSGKTRLALQVAAMILEWYPQGVWLVDLAPLSEAALVIQTIAVVLCIHEQAGGSALAAVTDFVCDKCMLLLLDNCEHLIGACAEASDTLLHACPNLNILATSREALGIQGEHIFFVPTLALPSLDPLPPIDQITQTESVRLLLDRAIAIQPSFELNEKNIAAVAQICHRLDGIPLAIELGAARLKLLSPEQIATRLDDRFKLLTGGSRTALPHHQTLEALIDWSHDLLSEEERVLFHRLSVFSGGWTLEAAEVVCAAVQEVQPVIKPDEILDLLAGLVNKSLVVVEEKGEETRFRLLRTIRAYSLTRLRQTEEEDPIQRKHLIYYLRMAEAAEREFMGENHALWERRLTAEQDNLRGALSWALQKTATTMDVAAGALMTGTLSMYWYLHAHLNEGRRWLTLARDLYPERSKVRAKVLTGSGILAWQQADYQEARGYFEESLPIWRELKERDGLAETLHFSGHLAFDQRDYDTARTLFVESLEYYQEVGDTQRTLTLTSDMGLVDYHLGDYVVARARFEETLRHWREIGNQEAEADVLNRLGDLVRVEGDLDLAQTLYEESLGLFRTMNVKLGIASGLHKLGIVARHKGDIKRASKLLVKSLMLQQEAGNKQGIVECLAGLAGVALAEEDHRRAAVLFGAAEALLKAIGAPLAPADRFDRDQDIESLHGKIHSDVLSGAWQEGCDMPQSQAIAYALRVHK